MLIKKIIEGKKEIKERGDDGKFKGTGEYEVSKTISFLDHNLRLRHLTEDELRDASLNLKEVVREYDNKMEANK